MTNWHTVPVKFTTEEKKILDILRDQYGMSHNKSLRTGLEIFARIVAMAELYQKIDSKVIRQVRKLGNKSVKNLKSEVKKTLQNIPLEQQESDYEKFSTGRDKIFSEFDRVFVKTRKKGRKKRTRKRGRPRV
jgi:hypothetical protein